MNEREEQIIKEIEAIASIIRFHGCTGNHDHRSYQSFLMDLAKNIKEGKPIGTEMQELHNEDEKSY